MEKKKYIIPVMNAYRLDIQSAPIMTSPLTSNGNDEQQTNLPGAGDASGTSGNLGKDSWFSDPWED